MRTVEAQTGLTDHAGTTCLAFTNLWKRIHGRRLAQGSEFELSLSKPGEVLVSLEAEAKWHPTAVLEMSTY